METRLLYIHALSPIQSGTGQSVDVIDLPVAREQVSKLPYLPGSSLKGVLRDACDPGPNAGVSERTIYDEVFGSAPQPGAENVPAGRLWFADGRLLCFPVRSLYGSFLWMTSPLLLHRWLRDGGAGGDPAPEVPALDDGQVLIGMGATQTVTNEGTVYLEDLDFRTQEREAVNDIAGRIGAVLFDAAWQNIFAARLAIVGDDVLSFLTETGTEVSARIRLNDDTKTVADGGLWYEEAVPAESIFVSPLAAAPRAPADRLFAFVAGHLGQPLQIGGNASIGRGLVRLRLHPGRPS